MIRIFFLVVSCVMSACCFAQTQGEMSAAAAKDYQKADEELNVVYQKVLKEYNSDTAFTKNLKKAQRTWIQFRDAEVSAMYPEREAGYYGTIHPVCRYAYLKDLTAERTEKLKIWLTGIEEGDACSGSVKIKQ